MNIKNRKVASLLLEVNIIIDKMMNAILHQKPFQQLEANWLQLNHLIQPSDHVHFRIYILSISDTTELVQKNRLLHLCYHDRYQMPGAVPFSILSLLYYTPLPLEQLNYIAQQVFLPIILPAYSTRSSMPAFIYTLAPQMLLRVPYHMEQITLLDEYLWGNPCFYFLEMILKKKPFSSCYHNRRFRYINPPNDQHQLWLFEFTYEEHDKHSGKLSIISLMIFCRFIHCLKIQLRDKIGQFSSPADAEQELQSWINQYCSQLAYQNYYPLKHAAISLKESGAANSYICYIKMSLHMDASIFSNAIEFQMEL